MAKLCSACNSTPNGKPSLGAGGPFFFATVRITNFLMVLPVALSVVGIGSLVNKLLRDVVPLSPASEAATLAGVVIFTVAMMFVHDFGDWAFHYIMHKVPALWELHKVHHSAELLVGVTRYRVHPIEVFMNKAWDGVVGGMIYGLWLFIAVNPAEIAIFGISIYRIRSIIILETTRHTHYKISFGKLMDKIVISPHYHQLHHSAAPKHFDKNFGSTLAIWDRLFGTFCAPEPGENFVFGLSDEENVDYRSCLRLYLVPLQKLLPILRATLTARIKPVTTL
jgi:sterol desaturase/sphingolipid hydroxylase (fatty acid hydroxylase superfamily)